MKVRHCPVGSCGLGRALLFLLLCNVTLGSIFLLEGNLFVVTDTEMYVFL